MKTTHIDYFRKEKITFTKEQAGALLHTLNNVFAAVGMTTELLTRGLTEVDLLNKPYCKKAIEFAEYKKCNPTTYKDLIERIQYGNDFIKDLTEYLTKFTQF